MRIALFVSTIVAGGLRGLAMLPTLAAGPLARLEVLWRVPIPSTRLQSVTPFMDSAATGSWRGETVASDRHRGNLVVGLARTLFPCVPMG